MAGADLGNSILILVLSSLTLAATLINSGISMEHDHDESPSVDACMAESTSIHSNVSTEHDGSPSVDTCKEESAPLDSDVPTEQDYNESFVLETVRDS